jgi:hypothetical protein
MQDTKIGLFILSGEVSGKAGGIVKNCEEEQALGEIAKRICGADRVKTLTQSAQP